MKYVIFEYPNGARFPVIFNELTAHSQVKLEHSAGQLAKPISAGFFEIGSAGVRVYGQSESLKLKPRKSDHRLLLYALTNSNARLIEENINFTEKRRQHLASEEVKQRADLSVAQGINRLQPRLQQPLARLPARREAARVEAPERRGDGRDAGGRASQEGQL